MISASTDELLEYLADVVASMERYGATVLLGDGDENIAWQQDDDGSLVMDLVGRLPHDGQAKAVDLGLQERWARVERDSWQLIEYGYELLHRELNYRRALHFHDSSYFVRSYGVATHEHCESPLGHEVCGRYAGEPVRGALDGFLRLYDVWLSGRRPDCSALRCLK